MSKVTVIGSGYVGLVTGVCLAELGNDVFCLDLNQKKIDGLNNGIVPIFEPGLKELIEQNMRAGRVRFSTDIQAAVAHGDYQFIAVGTPPGEDGSADLSYVLAAARNIGKYMDRFQVIVDKSTVPVGTADKVRSVIQEELGKRKLQMEFAVVSNPEFLKEGAAIEDFTKPDRIVIGTDSTPSGLKAREQMKHLYAPFNRNHERTFYMDTRSAELTKYAANAMLATRISFMNELANLADKVGADIEKVRVGIGSDARIGYPFLYAGTGYGGSCFPKDVQALCKIGDEVGESLKILSAVERVNQDQKTVLIRQFDQLFAKGEPRSVGIWGLSFKPNTDDMREAPSKEIVKALVDRGILVRAYDPVATQEAQHLFKGELGAAIKQVTFVTDMYEAVKEVDALFVVTEWKSFKSPDFQKMKSLMSKPIIFDGRNLYEPLELQGLGFDYFTIGRNSVVRGV